MSDFKKTGFMKNMKPVLNGRYHQGLFNPQNPQKYKGQMPIIYRSELEFKFCTFCDETPKVLKWSSEPMYVDWIDPVTKKTHHYHPDFVIEIFKNGITETIVIEVKPLEMIKQPKPLLKSATTKNIKNYNLKLKTFIINMTKMKAAQAACNKLGFKYMFLTESFFN